jgi:hypothetical protein
MSTVLFYLLVWWWTGKWSRALWITVLAILLKP